MCVTDAEMKSARLGPQPWLDTSRPSLALASVEGSQRAEGPAFQADWGRDCLP